MIISKEVEAGQAIYTKPVLMIYDWWVLGFSNSFIWQHPTRHLVDLYQTYTTHNHLDIGVGTGYFLDKCELDKSPEWHIATGFPVPAQALVSRWRQSRWRSRIRCHRRRGSCRNPVSNA